MDHDEHRQKGLTRRDFLTQTGLAALAGLAGWETVVAAQRPRFAAARPAATVALVRERGALNANGSINAEAVERMVFDAVRALTGERQPQAAWRRLFRESDSVGVKFSRCGWMRVPTSQEVIDGVIAGLAMVPVARARIHSADAGLPVAECTAVVNVTSLKAHPLAGMAAAIKNYINCHPKPDQYHGQSNAKLPEVWLRPELKGKTRLIVLDLLTPYFGTGPQIDPRYKADYRGILAATDPVAADTVALSLCQKLRERYKGKPWPLSPPPLWLVAAERQYHLGTADPEKIRLLRLGWTSGMLV